MPDALLSREVAVGILAAAGMAVPALTLPTGIVAIAALLKAGTGYKAERAKALGEHAISWVFGLTNRAPVQWY